MPRTPLWPLPLLLVLALSCDGYDERRPMASTPASSTTSATSISSSPSLSTGKMEAKPLPAKGPPHAATRPLMIGFTRDYCLPCQVMKPWIAELKRKHAQTVDVVVVNLDRKKNERFAPFLGTRSVPTQIFVGPGGHVEARHEGVATVEKMTRTFRRLGWTD